MENVPADVVPDNGPRKRGRPKKVTVAVASGFDGPKRGVGRPRKTAAVVHSDGSMVVEGEGVRKVVEGEAVRGKVGEGEAVKRKVGRPSTGWKEEREASKARMAAKRARKEFEVEKRAYLKRTDQAEFRGERMSRQEAQGGGWEGVWRQRREIWRRSRAPWGPARPPWGPPRPPWGPPGTPWPTTRPSQRRERPLWRRSGAPRPSWWTAWPAWWEVWPPVPEGGTAKGPGKGHGQ